eukprot:Lankesteria_metandrocarpae@DN5250_c0_g1_i5.p1
MGFDPDNLPHGRPNTLPIPRPELPDADGTIIIGGGIVGPGTNPDSNGGVIIGGGVIGVNPNEDNSFPNNFPNLPNRPGNNPNFPNFPVNKPNYPNLPNLPDTDKEGVIGGIIGALRPQDNEEDRFPNLPDRQPVHPNLQNPNFPNFPNFSGRPDTDKEGVIGGIIGALRPQDNEEDRFPNLPDRQPVHPNVQNPNFPNFPNFSGRPDTDNEGVIGGIIGALRPQDNEEDRFPNLPDRQPVHPNLQNPNFPNFSGRPDTDKEGVIGGIIGALRPQHNEEDRFPNLPNSNGILGHEDPKLTAHISLEGEMHIHVDSGSLCNDKCCCDGREDLASGVQGALENGKEIIKDAVEQAKENQMENTSAQRPRHTVADNEAIKAFKERHSGKSKFLDDEPMMIELVPGMKEEVWRGFHLLDNIRTHITYAESSKPTDGYHYGTEIDSGAVVKIVRWVANNQEFVKAAVRAHDLGLLSAVPTESGGYVCKLLSESKLSQSKVCVPTIDLMKMTLMFRKRLESVLQNISSVRSADDRDPTSSRFRGTLHPAGDPETMPHPTEFDYYPSTMGWRSWWR